MSSKRHRIVYWAMFFSMPAILLCAYFFGYIPWMSATNMMSCYFLGIIVNSSFVISDSKRMITSLNELKELYGAALSNESAMNDKLIKAIDVYKKTVTDIEKIADTNKQLAEHYKEQYLALVWEKEEKTNNNKEN